MRIRIPADLNEEDIFLSWGPIKLSMRQVAILAIGVFIWFLGAKYFIVPILGLTMLFALIAMAWVPIVAAIFAIVKIHNKPIDMWLGHKIAFIFSARTFVLREDKKQGGVDTDVYSDDELDHMLNHNSETKVYSRPGKDFNKTNSPKK